MLVLLGVEQRGAEEVDGKLAVALVLELGQQLLVGLVGGVEALDGLQHKRVDDELVVVPVEALLLQHGVELLVVLYELAVELAPHLPVGLVVVGLVGHVVLVGLALLYLVAELAYEFKVVAPAVFLALDELAEHLVGFQLQGELVVAEFGRGLLRTFSFGTLA